MSVIKELSLWRRQSARRTTLSALFSPFYSRGRVAIKLPELPFGLAKNLFSLLFMVVLFSFGLSDVPVAPGVHTVVGNAELLRATPNDGRTFSRRWYLFFPRQSIGFTSSDKSPPPAGRWCVFSRRSAVFFQVRQAYRPASSKACSTCFYCCPLHVAVVILYVFFCLSGFLLPAGVRAVLTVWHAARG